MTDLTETTPVDQLQKLPYWNPTERIVSAEPAGQSNMNLVLRIQTSERSLILKQSKPYVRKYPQIPAPIERIGIEHRFLDILAHDEFLAELAPKVLHFDSAAHVLITGDLGKSADFSGMYSQTKELRLPEIQQLTEFLNRLHGLSVENFPDNLAMRRLNHEHIFRFPFSEENGFDLDQAQPGLQQLSLSFKKDKLLRAKLEKLGARYLGPGSCLLHGDFYPGSWLDTPTGVKVIDPEFGFLGDREFDLGVFFAHLELAQVSEEIIDAILTAYLHPVDLNLVNQYRGVEILRRLIGIAQLPLSLSLSRKSELLAHGKSLILS